MIQSVKVFCLFVFIININTDILKSRSNYIIPSPRQEILWASTGFESTEMTGYSKLTLFTFVLSFNLKIDNCYL